MLHYQEPFLPESRKIITEKILENVARKEGGIQAIFDLHRNFLPIIFGLNAVGFACISVRYRDKLEQCSEVFRNLKIGKVNKNPLGPLGGETWKI